MDIIVKKVGVEKKTELIDLCCRTYGTQKAALFKQRFDWQFDGQFGCKDFFVIELKDKLIASIASMPCKLKIGQENYNASWACNLMANSLYQNKGLGVALIKEFKKEYPLNLFLGVSQKAYLLMKELGLQEVKNLHFMYRIINPVKVLANKLRKKFLLKIPTITKNLFPLNIINNKRFRYEYTEINQFPEAANILINNMNQKFFAVVIRDINYLTWKYLRHPYHKYYILQAATSKGIEGLIIYRLLDYDGLNYAFIVEIIGCSDEVIDELIDRTLMILHNKKVDIVKTFVTDRKLKKIFHNRLFFQRNESPEMFLSLPSEIDYNISFMLMNSSNWFLTKGDSDSDLL